MSSQRNLSIDVIRLIAAFGVVIIHLSPSTRAADAFTQLFWLFAVPFFLLMSLFFFIKKGMTASSLKFSELHVDRILVPYLAWTVIYTLLRLLKFHFGGKSSPLDVVGLIFYGTGAVQLYFLPLLLLFQAEAFVAIIAFRGLKWRLPGLLIAVGAVLFGIVGSAGSYLGFNHEPEFGLMYVALAFLLVYSQTKVIGRRINIAIGCLIFASIISTALLGYPLKWLGMISGPLVGYGVSALALNWKFNPATSALRYLLTCSYGIYLAHVVFLECFDIALQKWGWSLAPYSVTSKIIMGGLICLCCVGFIKMVRRHWLPAYLFIGEGHVPSQYWLWKHQPEVPSTTANNAI